MFGWRTADVAFASLKKRATISLACEYCGSSTFTAAGRPSIVCSARYTTPMPPSLMRETMRWLPTTAPITPHEDPPAAGARQPQFGRAGACTRSTTAVGGGGIPGCAPGCAMGCAPAPGGGGGGVGGRHGEVTVIFTSFDVCAA